jgi:DNA repair protein RadA/Sms
VPGAERRLAEAARAGFTRALVPPSIPGDAIPPAMEVQRVRTLAEALTSTIPLWSTVAASR